jgi:hypothetical protein
MRKLSEFFMNPVLFKEDILSDIKGATFVEARVKSKIGLLVLTASSSHWYLSRIVVKIAIPNIELIVMNTRGTIT